MNLAEHIAKLEAATKSQIAATITAARELHAGGRSILAVRLGSVQLLDTAPTATWTVNMLETTPVYHWREPSIGAVTVTGCTFNADEARGLGCPAELVQS